MESYTEMRCPKQVQSVGNLGLDRRYYEPPCDAFNTRAVEVETKRPYEIEA